MAVPSRQPRKALCALFYTMALCLMCVWCVGGQRDLFEGVAPEPQRRFKGAAPEKGPLRGSYKQHSCEVSGHTDANSSRYSPFWLAIGKHRDFKGTQNLFWRKRLWHCIVCGQNHPYSPFWGLWTPRRGWRTGIRWTRRSHRKVVRPDSLGWSTQAP